MLYSQALTGGHRASLPSSTPYSTTKTTTRTSTEASKQHHQNPTKTPRAINPQPRTQNQNQTHHQPSNPDHKPNTTTREESVYVLTLKTTPSLTDPLTALRRSHFPRHRDRGNLPAHLTLFHALPGSEIGHITAALEEVSGCAPRQKPLRLATGAVFRMRRGVGIEVAEAVGGREEGKGGDGHGRAGGESGPAAARWLHWTVQNKAADEAAVDAAMDEVQTAFRGAEGLATGCALWRYDKGGRWAFERGFDFGGDK